MWVAERLGANPLPGPERAFGWPALIMLYVGMVLGLLATALYVRRGRRELRPGRQDTASS